MTTSLRYTVRSDVGLLREGNEDSAYAGPHLLAIADGMGGHAAGEVASAVAIKTLVPLDTDPRGTDMLRALGDAIASANATLHDITLSDPATEGMGTTLTALLWSGDEVALCHIGDSRAYLLRDGVLRQITHDHTLVQTLVDEGRLTPEAAASHPQRSLVMRALQSSIPADPDLSMMRARVGDRFLLCSDGLTDVVSDETLRMTLQELPDLDDAVEKLVDLAIRSGGPDNITCVLADVIDTDSGQPPSEEIIIVGALATDDGDASEPTRSDNPAARAHLLAQGVQGAHRSGARQVPSTPAAMPEPTAVVGSAQDHGAEDHADGAHVDGAHLGSGLGDSTSQGTADDGSAAGAFVARRRRWPVVSSVLVLLVGVVGAAGYYGWRLTQEQYYVGTDNGHVVVYRGVSQAVAGLSLSRVVRRTNIPLAQLPSSEAGSIRSTIGPEASLRQAMRIISQFQQDYHCAVVQSDITKWVANRPKPLPSAHKRKATSSRANAASKKSANSRPASKRSKTSVRKLTTTRHAGTSKPGSNSAKKPVATHRPAYPPKPVLPAYCPAMPGGSG
ncbi:MAG TPA: PP2C family serine/threonine-protein phosphatase [Streptosporangiaceae bacterium]|nr:PP2C family serine/threonine-protein phosphatase [Streptosporangiaceae bacterium]